MENNEQNQTFGSIVNTLEKIKKKQGNLKKSLGEINKFIKAKFNKERKEEENKFNEFCLNINKEFENKLEKIKTDILKEVKINSTQITQQKENIEIFKSQISNIPEKDYKNIEINNFEISDNEEKESKEEKQFYSLEFLSENIILKKNINDFKNINRLNFKVKIRNNGNAKIPKGTFIEFEKNDENFKILYCIDELIISEEKEYSLTIYINKKKEEFKDKYYKFESNLIFKNDNYEIKYNPIKFTFIAIEDEEEDDESETIKIEDDYPIQNIFNNNDKTLKEDMIDPYKDMDDKPIEINEDDFKKIKESLDIKYNLSAFKDQKYIKNKIIKYKDDYLKYQKTRNKDEKETILDELTTLIGENFWAESEYEKPKYP